MNMTTMNNFICAFICILSAITYGQEQKHAPTVTPIANIDHYGIDFEVLEFGSNPDTAYVNALNLDEFEHTRKHDEDNHIHDLINGYTIVIYSFEKAQMRKSNAQEMKGTHQFNPFRSGFQQKKRKLFNFKS